MPTLVVACALIQPACDARPGADSVQTSFEGPEPAAVATPSLEIGNGDVNEEEAFFLIGKVEVDRDGGILVLDWSATHIAWFDRDGRFIARLGRSGSGPGEFRRLTSMTIDRDNRLHVLDELRHQIVIYELHDTIADHVEDQPIERIVRDICAIGNRRFTMTPTEADIVHEIDEQARVIRSFAPAENPVPDNAGDPRIVRSLRAFPNRTVMACDEGSETIVLLHQNIPLVRAFTPQGRERWRTVLEDFHGREIRPLSQAAKEEGVELFGG